MAVLKQVAEEKKVSSPLEFCNEFYLTLHKASSFSVVERIPEMDEIKLGGVGLCNFPGQVTLIRTPRTGRISSIPKRCAGRGALPGFPEISSQCCFRRGSARAFQAGSDQDPLARTMPNRS